MANMGTPLGQMIVELGLDSSKFGKGLQSAKKRSQNVGTSHTSEHEFGCC